MYLTKKQGKSSIMTARVFHGGQSHLTNIAEQKMRTVPMWLVSSNR